MPSKDCASSSLVVAFVLAISFQVEMQSGTDATIRMQSRSFGMNMGLWASCATDHGSLDLPTLHETACAYSLAGIHLQLHVLRGLRSLNLLLQSQNPTVGPRKNQVPSVPLVPSVTIWVS